MKLQEIPKTTVSNLIELANLLDKAIIMDRGENDIYRRKFNEFDSYPEAEYENMMDFRLNCFAEAYEHNVVNDINHIISTFEPLEIRPIIDKALNDVDTSKQIKFGALFLLGIIIDQRPDLITPQIFKFAHEEIPKFAPVICWIIGRSLKSEKITHLEPLLTHQLIEIFMDVMTDPDPSYDPAAVCAIHMIKEAFEKQKVYRITATHYAKLLNILERDNTIRDCRVRNALGPLMESMSIMNMKDLAPQLMEYFPDPPEFIVRIFVREISELKNATFIDGWIEAHTSHREISMKYLDGCSGRISERIVCKFPKEDLRQGSNRVKLAVVKVELMNSSFRFCFAAFLLTLFILLYKRKYIS